MKILIVGTGLSGSSIARFLKDKGHNVSLIEKENYVGGLCITRISEDGLKYEPFGARTFHTRNPKIKSFITKFDDFNGIRKKTLPSQRDQIKIFSPSLGAIQRVLE